MLRPPGSALTAPCGVMPHSERDGSRLGPAFLLRRGRDADNRLSIVAAGADVFSRSIAGVRLDRYAGICASLIEGFSLQAALENDGMSLKAWERSAPAWAAKLGAEPPAGSLRAAYAEKVLEARTLLGRRVLPLDSDLGSWLSFLAAFSIDPALLVSFQRVGLRRADISHLQGLWAGRADRSAELAKQVLALASKRKAAVPDLRIIPAALKPFPWSETGGTPPRPPPEAADSVVSLPPAGSPPPAVEIATPSFLLQCPDAPEQQSAAGADVPSARTPLDPGTSEFVLPAATVLPFASFGALTAPLAPNPGAPPKGMLPGGTAAIFELPKGLVLPFSEKGDSPRLEPPAALDAGQKTIGETSPVFELPRRPPLPFAPAPAKGAPSAAPGATEKAPSMPTGTAEVLELPKGAPLPFAASPRASPATADSSASPPEARSEKRASLGETVMAFDLRTLMPAAPIRGATAPGAPAGAPARDVPLTMEQHASLCAELALYAGRETDILVRYRVTADARAHLDRHYAAVVAASPDKRRAWHEAYRTYHEWLVAAARSR